MKPTRADLARRWLTRKPESLTETENRVLQSALDRKSISRNVNDEDATRLSTGDRIADQIARVGGSWSFIISFLVFLVLWTLGNGFLLARDAFDPYPFIFLNLVLSMIAALQAPVIMMSQNRQTERDRIDAGHDYEVNLKAEIEIMALHEKFDEIRHLDIVAMHADVTAIKALVLAIENRLASADGAR